MTVWQEVPETSKQGIGESHSDDTTVTPLPDGVGGPTDLRLRHPVQIVVCKFEVPGDGGSL